MADRKRIHPRDKGNGWFVDTTCIDCDVARLIAPGLIAEDENGLSYFTRPPTTAEEKLLAWRALLACPSASIGAPPGEHAPEDALPWQLAPGAYLLGHNSRASFGANSWLVTRPDGNVMIDAPRWAPRLAERIAAMGGLAHILLTHRDDVADYAKYAAHFGAKAWIHEDDRRAAPDAAAFREAFTLQPGVRVLPFPGHTKGSAMFLVDDKYLFTGDSLSWERDTDDLHAFENFTWYSWDEQKRSLARLAEEARFEWVFPGHGGWGQAPADDMRRRLLALVERM